MKLLLDTHAFIWFVEGDPQLSAMAAAAIASPSGVLYLSVASVWGNFDQSGEGKVGAEFAARCIYSAMDFRLWNERTRNPDPTRPDGGRIRPYSWRSV